MRPHILHIFCVLFDCLKSGGELSAFLHQDPSHPILFPPTVLPEEDKEEPPVATVGDERETLRKKKNLTSTNLSQALSLSPCSMISIIKYALCFLHAWRLAGFAEQEVWLCCNPL